MPLNNLRANTLLALWLVAGLALASGDSAQGTMAAQVIEHPLGVTATQRGVSFDSIDRLVDELARQATGAGAAPRQLVFTFVGVPYSPLSVSLSEPLAPRFAGPSRRFGLRGPSTVFLDRSGRRSVELDVRAQNGEKPSNAVSIVVEHN